MAIRTLAGNLALQGDYDEGFTGWGAGMNENLQKLSFMVQPAVINIGITSPPVSPVQGDMYILGAGASLSAWGNPSALSLVAWDNGSWKSFMPKAGVLVYNKADNMYYRFSGSAWLGAISYNALTDVPPPYVPPPFVGVACHLDSDYTIPTLNTYLRVPFNANGCTIAPVGINANILARDYYFTQDGIYQAHFAAEINNNSATGKGFSGRINLVNPDNAEITVAESASVQIISGGDNLQRIGVQMSALFFASNNSNVHFAVNGSQQYTLVSGPRTRFSILKVS